MYWLNNVNIPLNVLVLLSQTIFILLSIALFTLVERKVLSSIQRRKGPNTVGFFFNPMALIQHLTQPFHEV